MHPTRLASLLLLLVVACLALGRAPAHAGTLIVMNTNDSGAGSLRQAIADATTGTGILFDASIQGGTINLNSPLVINKAVGIDGSTARMTLKAVNSTRVLEASSDMNLGNLNIESGNSADNGGAILHTFGQFNFHDSSIKNSHADADGGGIYVAVDGDAILTNVLIDGNTAGRDGGGLYGASFTSMDLDLITVTNNEAAERGGGIFLDQVSVLLEVVTIADNTAEMGGGIFSNAFFGLNGTLSGNQATQNGGALYINAGEPNLRNTTISGNSAAVGGAIEMQPGATTSLFSGTITKNAGGGLHLSGGTLNIETTIIADQTTGPGCSLEGSSVVASNGYNLATDDTCRLGHSTDIEDGFANLGPLTLDPQDADVKTHAPLEGSDALNRIPIDINAVASIQPVRCGVTLAIDARSVARPQGPGCEIGAYEAIQEKLARIWGDNLCNNAIDAGDALTELAFVAGVPWERLDGCISVGSRVSGDALPANVLPWADVNCDGTLTAVDALDVMLASIELPRDNGPACPFIGRDVNLLG